MMLAIIELPWPSRALHPNAREHWTQIAKAKKRARELAYWTAKAYGVKLIETCPLQVSLTYYPPDKRRRDLDGMLSASKAFLDGLSDALGVDDHHFRISAQKSDRICPDGMVVVEISEAT